VRRGRAPSDAPHLMTTGNVHVSGRRSTTGRVVLLGLPYDAASSLLRGPAGAPPLIRAALDSDSNNGWSESLADLRAPGLVGDAGDVDVGGPDDVRPRIESVVTAVLDSGARPLCLGGDHSVTYPILRALRRHHPRLALLHLDAHPDLYDALDGDRYSHACPFARIMEDGLVDRLVQVGIRTMNGHQRAQADRFGVEVVTMQDWDSSHAFAFDQPLYVSVDLDVLDPAFAPGVSHREPGGLSVRELLHIIQRTRADIVAADVVEFNPTVDPVGITAWVAAKIVRELVARMLDAGR
jgi:agmatinase